MTMRKTSAIGKHEIDQAREELNRCRAHLAPLRQRMEENERWWQMQNLPMTQSILRETDGVSGWLFNSVASKHADAMDNYPSLSVLPREPGDENAANILSAILPVILEENGFEAVYDRCWYDKLKNGTGCYGVFWNAEKRGGQGDVEIRAVDMENLFWEPGVERLSDARYLFYVSQADREETRRRWPQLRDAALDDPEWTGVRGEDARSKVAVIDWYYKKRKNGRTILHLCKFTGTTILFASENEDAFPDGIYRHGEYPFILDRLYPVKGSPAGLGLIDRMKGAQRRIDILQNAITENALEAVNSRWFIRDSAGINEEEFCDHRNKLVHVSGEVDDGSVKPIRQDALNGNYLRVLESAIQEMKEVSGNRDASTGGSGGVTAASAIAAMQEAGSKLSRDMVRTTYRAFTDLCTLVIEDIRQFYTGERVFRITGRTGESAFLQVGNDFYRALDSREAVYDIVVRPMKESPYTRLSRNELALQLYKLGLFAESKREEALLCLEMMDFDGRQEVMGRIRSGLYALYGTKAVADEGEGVREPLNRFEETREKARSLHEVAP